MGKAKELSKLFGLDVAQSLYSDWGNFYGPIKQYPCALWDKSGYLVIKDENQLQVSGVSIKKRINIYEGISSLVGYKHIFHSFQIPEELPEESKFIEGAKERITVNRYERDRRAREVCVAHYGYICQVCRIQLSNVYGPIAESLIHVHHIEPISETAAPYTVDPIADLIPLCPNCHAVIHLRNPPYSLEELRSMIHTNRIEKSA